MLVRPTIALSALAVLAACSSPVVESPDAGSTQTDASADAPRCGSCDDGDPATTDACVDDRCEHRLCVDDAACDDGEPNTGDHCILVLDTSTWTCGHASSDGNCETDADCFDAVDCTRDDCGTGGRCTHTWIPACEGDPTNVLRVCPGTAAEGGACGYDESTGTNFDCREGDGPCADWLHCVGNTFDAHYVRVETVRAGCDAGECPSEVPSGLCTPDLHCDYGERIAPGRVYCDCWDRRDDTIAWSCADQEPCPLTPPEDGAAVDRTSVTTSASCYYGDYVCEIDQASWTWSCETMAPMFCPALPPAAGDECELPSECRFYGPETASDPVTTYRGVCTCDGAHWSCTPNEAADCPAEEPMPGSAFYVCTPSTGNAHCWYPPGPSSELWTHCHCDGPFETNLWLCEESIHY